LVLAADHRHQERAFFDQAKITNNLRRLMLALDADRHDFIIGGAHAEQLEFAYEVEDLRQNSSIDSSGRMARSAA
jgi:hypothetical protein